LSSWTVAFNGSEPIRGETIERFAGAFEPFGFRRDSFVTCYGLAEATLLVSGSKTSRPPRVARVLTGALKRHHVVDAPPGPRASEALVGSGGLAPGQQTIVVNPRTLTRCAVGRVGEIWVSGPSVAAGYYNHSEETRTTFQAYLSDTADGPFLRTGDLGFIRDG